jgi:predicted O-methyltransferase YrrM
MRLDAQDPQNSYVERLTAATDHGLLAIEKRLRSAGRWGVNIGANEGRLLALLIHLSGAKRVVEIGTLFGYSTVWLARALPSDGRVWTIERDAENAANARQGFAECGVSEKIDLIEGDASDKLRELEALRSPVDVVFIDANKSAYLDYLDWAERNLRAGGLIVADNIFLGGAVFSDSKPDHVSQRQWQGMRDFNQRLLNGGKFKSAFVPTSEGLLVGMRTLAFA